MKLPLSLTTLDGDIVSSSVAIDITLSALAEYANLCSVSPSPDDRLIAYAISTITPRLFREDLYDPS